MISFLAAPSLNTASCGRLSTLKNERHRSHKKAFQDRQEMVHPIIGTATVPDIPVFPVSQEISSSSCQIFFVASTIPCVSVAFPSLGSLFPGYALDFPDFEAVI